jgi:hypothetical protein
MSKLNGITGFSQHVDEVSERELSANSRASLGILNPLNCNEYFSFPLTHSSRAVSYKNSRI